MLMGPRAFAKYRAVDPTEPRSFRNANALLENEVQLPYMCQAVVTNKFDKN
jgi:hypothetical protein